jgi:hypothetical protein
MQQIIHTCLLAMRLISSAVGSQNIDLQYINTFDRGLLNAAFGYVYSDPGVLKKQMESALALIPVQMVQTAD